ncbi:universal stress protein [Nocardia xishanensis]|uniref:universal stress protein n=1 Tax=Nocardia xishanensis TaxID=238964 RepID=UPI00342CD4B0
MPPPRSVHKVPRDALSVRACARSLHVTNFAALLVRAEGRRHRGPKVPTPAGLRTANIAGRQCRPDEFLVPKVPRVGVSGLCLRRGGFTHPWSMGSDIRVEPTAGAVLPSAAQPPVLVGMDESEVAVRAAYWAAIEADARRAPLQLVHVATHDEVGLAGLELLLAARRTVLDRWKRTCERPAPAIEPRVVAGDPVGRLTELSATATLLVLGDSQAGPLAGLLHGSVAATLVGASRCPVALIRPLHNAASAVGPVLVAVEDTSSQALPAAFRAAATRHSSLLVADIRRRRASKEDLDTLIARHRRQFPTVTVQCVTVAGDRHAALERFSATAQLLVIARGGHRHLHIPLSPTLHFALHHTRCPVLVLPQGGAVATGGDHVYGDRFGEPAFG